VKVEITAAFERRTYPPSGKAKGDLKSEKPDGKGYFNIIFSRPLTLS